MTGLVLDEVLRRERPRVIAALAAGSGGDLGLAEDALQDACAKAWQLWPQEGLPRNPAAWLTTVARRRMIDLQRRQQRFVATDAPLAAEAVAEPAPVPAFDEDSPISDHRLELIFTCCHPALAAEAQVGLALRVICGLSTREIARAFLEPEPTTAQRLVRAKRKILEARIPYRIPPAELLPERLAGVLATVYLVFNEGYAATEGDSWHRPDVTAEAIRLGRMVVETMPAEPEASGLLALMLLTESRREARLNAEGGFVPLDEQDRSLWRRDQIEEGLSLLHAAMERLQPGPYQLQAAIAALHAEAATAAATDWRQIAVLYRALLQHWPTPIVELNAAVAYALGISLEGGLDWIDQLAASRETLANYHFLPAARADLLRRAGRIKEARHRYEEALRLVRHPTERAYLERRIAALDAS